MALFPQSSVQATNNLGNPVSGAKWKFYLTGTTVGDTIRVYSLATGDMTAELTIPGFIRTAMFMNDDYIGIGVDDAGNSVEIYALGAGGTSITLDKTIDAFASQKVTLGVETISGSPYASAG